MTVRSSRGGEDADRPKSRKRGLAYGFLLTLGSILLTLVVLELGARVVLEPPPTVHIENLDADVPYGERAIETTGAPNEGLYVRTPTGLRLKRSSRVLVRNHWLSQTDIEIRTNSHGFRHAELGPKIDNELRILVLGDSVTFGDYVAEHQTYPAHIGRFLKKDPPDGLRDKTIQVINGGIGAVDLQNELAVLMDTGLRVEPDVVLVGLYLNDAKMSLVLRVTRIPPLLRYSRYLTWVFNRVDALRSGYAHRADESTSVREERERFRASNPVSRDDWRVDESGFNRLIDESFADWGFAWSAGYWIRVREVLSLMAEVARTEGFELAVVLLPVSYQVQAEILRDEPQQRFAEEMRALGIAHHDLLPALRAHFAKTGENGYYDHCHMKPEGNRLVGREIAAFLRERVLLSAGR